MQTKILLALDDSRHSKYAVHYAIEMAAVAQDLHFVLFHIQPMISLFLKDEAVKSFKAKMELDKVLKKNQEVANRMLNTYRDEMVRKGISEDRISIATQTRKLGLAKDIIEYAQEKRYDAIVVGRRGLTRLQEMFVSSVTNNILEHSQVIPVWLVDNEPPNTDILIAVDGSETSLRVIDHVSFMLYKNDRVRLTILHAASDAHSYYELNYEDQLSEEFEELVSCVDQECIINFHGMAVKKFEDRGIKNSQLVMKEIKANRNIGKAILDEQQKGNFGTLVIGRRGISNAFFMGPVARYLISKVSNCALWVVN